MMWRKFVAFLFGLMVIATTASFSNVLASDTGEGTEVTVILVSDNEADCTLAEYLANITGAVVVVTPWGVYDPNVAASIMSYGSDKVIIIGGPDAVVEMYEEDLAELNIRVDRWWGKNRYGTNLATIGNATAKLRIKFENHVIVVPGNDTVAIEAALREAVKVHGVIIFANNTTDVARVMMKIGVQPKNMTIIRTPLTRQIAERVGERVRNRVEGNVTEVEANITREMAEEAIIVSNERILTADELLANVSTLEKTRLPVAEKMLGLAMSELEWAKVAYAKGNYGEAYGRAMAAKAHAEFVIKVASEKWREIVKKEPAMMAKVFLHRVEAQLKVMENAGIDVSEVRALVDQLRTAIENREEDVIPQLMNKIRQKLLEAYARGKGKFKERVVFPAHGRAGEP